MIKIWQEATEMRCLVGYKHFIFNGGEEHVVIDYVNPNKSVTLRVLLHNSSDILRLLLITDALKRLNIKTIDLVIPYLPYARQDRVCNPGEAFSVKVMCDLINSQNYNKVTTVDLHSDVPGALLDNHRNVNNISSILYEYFTPEKELKDVILISPDAGSLKKCYKFAKGWEVSNVIRADKVRDVKTGQVTDTKVYCHDLQGKEVLIVDDICDGGRTFIELAKKLKEKNAGKISLYVTHGIFSKGFGVFDGLIDHIYTTNSFYEGPIHKKLTVIDIFEEIRN
jgi:ribose-phosphate pyrophosphokinase